ncbi:MAG: hypothetical protein J2P17_33905 [Mycobacterium sp.]|nr:hypothetical protein [Mycobacterium sp.]
MVNGAVGTKIINAALGNTARGTARADGLMLLFDPDTAHSVALMDAALISAIRTAAVSAGGGRDNRRTSGTTHGVAGLWCAGTRSWVNQYTN